MTNLNIDKICRICLGSDPCLASLFVGQANTFDGISFADMISQCTNFIVRQEDGFPQLICRECIERTNGAYRLKKLCETSHYTLRALLASVKKKSAQNLNHKAEDEKCFGNDAVIAEPLVKSEPESPKKEFYEIVEIKSESELSGAVLETMNKMGYSGTSANLQENELIMKTEFASDIDTETEDSDVDYQMQNEEHHRTKTDENGGSSCSALEGDQKLLTSGKTKPERTPNFSDSQEPCKCYHPDKVRALPANVKNHERSETGEKRSECQYCNEAFAKSGTLKNHKRPMRHFKYGKFSEDAMKKAVSLVNNGMSLRKASKETHVAFQTLARYVKKAAINKDAKMVPNYGVNQTFTHEEEIALADYIIDYARMFYGLTTLECRKLAYEMAVMNNKKRPRTWDEEKIAGSHWFVSFRKRHADLLLITPEGCNILRAKPFSRQNVDTFFRNLKDVLSRSPTCFDSGSRIFNIDEISTTIFPRAGDVVSEKSTKQASKVTSAERRTLVTTCCAISATGAFIPPVMIFPAAQFEERIIIGAPPGTLGMANPSGLMTSGCFVAVIKHFIDFTNCSIDNPSLLIMDNHESHICVEALTLAKDNGVTILTVPSHFTNKLQPLDVGVYGPFQTAYNAAVDAFMMENPGKDYSIYNVAAALGFAFQKAMTPSNIIAAFKKTGIFPLDQSIFTDVDLPSVTEKSDLVLKLPEVETAPTHIKLELPTIEERKSQNDGPLSKNALRCKMYREKKKSETQSENVQKAKNIQRCKAYRERMKEIRNEKNAAQALADDEKRRKRKTNAQYCKDYRYRQYLKKINSKIKESALAEDLRSNEADFQHGQQVLRKLT